MFKWVIKIIFISSSPFALLIINVKILSNFQKDWCTFGRKNDVWKKQGLSIFEVRVLWTHNFFSFVWNFDHVRFAINGKYSKFFYNNPNYYPSLVIFQTYKNVVLRSVHSFGWLLWLWFYPKSINDQCILGMWKIVHILQNGPTFDFNTINESLNYYTLCHFVFVY